MNEQDAIDFLTATEGKKPSEIGEAIDALYQIHRTYKKIAQQLPMMSDSMLGQRHRIFQLPKGILWKVDEGQIRITHAAQITRLKDEDAQWLLAITIVEKKLHANECEKVVNLILKEGWTIQDALAQSPEFDLRKLAHPS